MWSEPDGKARFTLELEGLLPETFGVIVNCIYVGRLDIDIEERIIPSLLLAASQLGFTSLVDLCKKHLIDNVSSFNLEIMMQLARRLSIPELGRAAGEATSRLRQRNREGLAKRLNARTPDTEMLPQGDSSKGNLNPNKKRPCQTNSTAPVSAVTQGAKKPRRTAKSTAAVPDATQCAKKDQARIEASSRMAVRSPWPSLV